MGTLTINGRRVTLDSSFANLSPEDQQKTVEEIAAQMVASQPQAVPGGTEPIDQQGITQLQGGPGPQPAQGGGVDLGTATAATLGGLVNGIPVAGPIVQNVSDAIVGGAAQLTGGDYGETVEGLRRRRQEAAERAPIARIAGELAGGIGALGALSRVPAAAQALGLTGNLGARVANSTVSGGAIAGADALARGETASNAAEKAGVGGALSGAIPIVGVGLRAGLNAVGRKVQPIVDAVFRPEQEAARRAGTAFARDAANPQAWGGADEVAAQSARIPIGNVDRGGETVRALARSVGNQSPEARAVINNLAEDRFAGQGQRAVEVVRRLTGGAVDDVAFQQAVRQGAQAANRPAYQRAYMSPAARAVWSPNIRRMMQSDMFRRAINEAETVGTDFAAISGAKAVRNPFVFGADGSIGLRKLADGSQALPDLPFWDVVQRNLRKTADVARRSGDLEGASRADQLRRMLNTELDAAVPEFQQARAGAAMFFGAEDALEAGRMFGSNMRMVPEARQAFAKFNAPEKAAFRTGYASSLIDRIMAASDRTNVINQVFKSPASREMIELAFGPAKAKELEAYIRAESLADMLRGAMGNSTTARQLMELGIGAGSGFAITGGDWKGALAGAAATKGARLVGQRVDNRVMQMVAKLLTSDNPQAVQLAVKHATESPTYMTALEGLGLLLAAPARGAALAIASE